MYWARHLVDILKAVDLISRPDGASIDELAARLDVSRRTAYRVIETLEELNFPLYEDICDLDGRKRWRFDDRYLKKLPNLAVPELGLTLAELVALSFLRGGGRLFKGTDVEKNIESAFVKLDAFVPGNLAKQLDKVRTLFAAAGRFTKNYSDKETVIEALTDAMFRQRTALVEYHAFGDDRVKHFKIDPLRFFERDGGLYVFVNTTSFGEIRILAVERIVRLTITDQPFAVPEDFDPDAILQSSFNLTPDDPLTVRVRFSAGQARYVRERRWAPGQTITEAEDGSVILEMKTSGRWDVKRWVLAFGADAEVLEPADLREEIAAELRATAEAYSRGGPCP
jgi:predicted DNA-binding transcriptional regulator YafY